MFRYCPSCASENIRFEKNKVFHCPECGFTYYHNTAAATACIVRTGAGLLFLVRNKEPGRGKLDLPGGFVDPGEGAMDGLRREFIEEIGWDPYGADKDPHSSRFVLFASFPNTYPYRNISYNTCDLFFFLDAPGLGEKDLKLETAEIAGVRFIRAEELDPEELAFESVKKAIGIYLADPPHHA
ncbi:MAG: NUDIX domain-containing protein [Treponema sp.]|jgi:ADP-ribose pyrophosphatase YjhB (NUDIX family)|nr:NUDIX domain-containing protein [Treponema sp.]